MSHSIVSVDLSSRLLRPQTGTIRLSHARQCSYNDVADNLQPVTNEPNHPKSNENNLMTSHNPPLNIWRITALFFWQITQGFNDATPGALLPYMESSYGISYTVVSLIWMANASGFIVIALCSSKIQPWLGREKSMFMATCLSIIMYSIVLSGTIFPVIVVAFFIGGCGLAIVGAQASVFLARLDKLTKYLSFCHASYGIGGTISPLIATAMASSGVPWHYFYLILLGMMTSNCILFLFAFKGSDKDLAPWDDDDGGGGSEGGGSGGGGSGGIGGSSDATNGGESANAANTNTTNTTTTTRSDSGLKGVHIREGRERDLELQSYHNNSSPSAGATSTKTYGHFMEAAKLPNTWLLALFVLFYQGSEVSLAGWIVTYLLDYRHGPPSVGYVASGFWAGLTIGRLVLTRPMDVKFGVKRSITVVSIISLILVGLCWAIPHTIAVGVLVCVAGFFIGPNYPLMISVTGSLIPRKVQVISLTIITAFGSSGGALFPFFVGLMSQNLGPFVVLPTFLVLYSLMVLIWCYLPNIDRIRNGENNYSWLQRIW